MEWVYGGERYGREVVERAAGTCIGVLEELAGGEVEASYALTPMQQGMLFHMLLAPEQGLYHEQTGLQLEGEMVPELWRQSWERVMARHEALRAEVHWQGEQPVQVIKRRLRVELEVEDWSGESEADYEQRLENELSEERRCGLRPGPSAAAAAAVAAARGGLWECLWSHPHLMLDGWAVPVVIGEVLSIYAGLRGGREAAVASGGRYRDYVAWLQQQDMGRAEAYWRGRLSGLEAPGLLPGERRRREASAAGHYGEQIRELDEAMTRRLEQAARQELVTLNTLVQAAWSLVLSRHSDGQEVVFGATVSGRPAELADVERTVGLFLNTLPVRAAVPERQAIGDWLRGLQQQEAEARQHEYASLADIQAGAGSRHYSRAW